MLVVVEVYMGSSRSFLGVPLPVAETETSSSCLRNTGIGVAALEADATGSDETAIAGGGGGGGAGCCCCCRGVSGSGDASRALIFMMDKHKAPTLHGQGRAGQNVTRWFAPGLMVVLTWLGQLQQAATATTTMRRSRSMREC